MRMEGSIDKFAQIEFGLSFGETRQRLLGMGIVLVC